MDFQLKLSNLTGAKRRGASSVLLKLTALMSDTSDPSIWHFITESELLTAIESQSVSSTTKQKQMYHLRNCLENVTQEARTRFPSIFRDTKTQRSVHNLTYMSVMPHGVFRQGPTSGLWGLYRTLFRHALRKSRMYSALSIRKAFSFLHGFLATGGVVNVTETAIQTEDYVYKQLHSVTRDEIIQMYQTYRDSGQRIGVRTSLPSIRRHLYLINLLFCDIVRAWGDPITLDSFGIQCRLADTWQGSDDDKFNDWVLPPAPQSVRTHTFNPTEIRALYLAADTLFERLMLLALFTTGMRIGGFCNIQTAGLFQADGSVSSSLWTREKNNKNMQYPVCDLLAEYILKWHACFTGGITSSFLFPGSRGTLHITTESVRRIFKGICKRANLTGTHVKPHTTRHTYFDQTVTGVTFFFVGP